jgi:transposase InsO family protein
MVSAGAGREEPDRPARRLRGTCCLIHDRDPLFTARFAGILRAPSVSAVKLPPRSPSLNAFAERFVRSAKQECLRKVIPLGEAHLRRIVAEYVEHYHRERTHQGLGNAPTAAPSTPSNARRGSAGRSGTTIARRHDFQAIEFRHHTASSISTSR